MERHKLHMATARPVVSVYNVENTSEKGTSLPMPIVLTTALRPDLVRYIHTNISKNKRQARAVGAKVGYDTAAESWGTGRAVARIPRAPGGGTHRAGQATFGNMCRGGGMFSPTKTWRRWHRKVNVTQKRHAVCSCLAASTIPPLVMARGHRIDDVSELPLVVSDGVESIQKTKDAVALLNNLGCKTELRKVIESKQIRAGKGKMRNRRYVMRKGPLVVYAQDSGITRAFRNIPGVDLASVDRLNLLQLAPGGNFGRFVIWTEGAFKKLNEIYGTSNADAPLKKGYRIPRALIANADITRIINSTEVQSVLRPKKTAPKTFGRKKNPLKNTQVMAKLNVGYLDEKAKRKAANTAGTPEYGEVQKNKAARLQAAKEHQKSGKKKQFYGKMMSAFQVAENKESEEQDGEAEN